MTEKREPCKDWRARPDQDFIESEVAGRIPAHKRKQQYPGEGEAFAKASSTEQKA